MRYVAPLVHTGRQAASNMDALGMSGLYATLSRGESGSNPDGDV